MAQGEPWFWTEQQSNTIFADERVIDTYPPLTPGAHTHSISTTLGSHDHTITFGARTIRPYANEEQIEVKTKNVYRGVIVLTPETLLELLGITTGDVEVRGIWVDNHRDNIQISIKSEEAVVPTHDGNGYVLAIVPEGGEIPRIAPQELTNE